MIGKRNLDVWLAILVCFAVSANPATAATIYVASDYPTIQEAIDEAVSGDEIEVEPGTYYEAIDFLGKAIRLYSSGGPASTIIDGTGNYHVVQCVSSEGPDTVLEGFTITGGNANGTWPNERGGGMRNHESSPTVLNCKFIGNTASYSDVGYGGGMSNKFSSPTVTGCTFEGNSAKAYGGGMHNDTSNPTVTDCTFTGNTTEGSGGGMVSVYSSLILTNCTFTANLANKNGGGMNSAVSSGTVTNCTFTANTSDLRGGGMRNDRSSPTVTNCTFTANSAGSRGGGMGNFPESSPTVTNCIFSDNAAEVDGGGMWNAVDSHSAVTNCTFTANSAVARGGGMWNDRSNPTLINCTFTVNSAQKGGGMRNDESSPTVTNCTFSVNTATVAGGAMWNGYGSNPIVTNCILWGDTPEEIFLYTSTAIVTYSDVQGGWTGTGNIDADPMFADADGRLSPGSPCIDTGNDAAVPPDVTTDLDGNRRIQGLCVDMGAFETTADPVKMLAGLALYIMDEVDAGNIDAEMEGSLLAKVDAAIAALDRDNPNDAKVAMNDLKALVNQVEAQVDKKITAEVAAEIIQRANDIIAELGG